ncbi:MAG: hypothetical protein ACP5E3_02605, partial [Bacteroidales bacterium]
KPKEISRTATAAKKETPEERKPVIQLDNFITDYDIYLFREGKHFSLHKKLGAHLMKKDDKEGTFFAVWAPNAKSVSVIGNFNGWLRDAHHLEARKDGSGIWQGFIPGVMKGEAYKYFISSNFDDYQVEKADPVGFYSEQPPKTASITWEYTYKWKDQKWMKNRKERNSLDGPISVYEVHLESWRHAVEDTTRPLSYRELAEQL